MGHTVIAADPPPLAAAAASRDQVMIAQERNGVLGRSLLIKAKWQEYPLTVYQALRWCFK